MTLFSRCEAPRGFESGPRASSHLPGAAASPGGFWRSLFGFLEDLGILARYAAGLDYYGRDRINQKH